MKIYLVTAGCYSDYHVIAAFSTREKAEDFRERTKLRFCEIEERPFDILDEEDFAGGRVLYEVRHYLEDCPSGRKGQIVPTLVSEYTDFGSLNVVSTVWSGTLKTVLVAARDEEHAVKIAADLFRIHKAEGGR